MNDRKREREREKNIIYKLKKSRFFFSSSYLRLDELIIGIPPRRTLLHTRRAIIYALITRREAMLLVARRHQYTSDTITIYNR